MGFAVNPQGFKLCFVEGTVLQQIRMFQKANYILGFTCKQFDYYMYLAQVLVENSVKPLLSGHPWDTHQ